MTEKQIAYLEKLEEFKFYYKGIHFGRKFCEVYCDSEYWIPLLPQKTTNKTIQLFSVYVELRRKCCYVCHGTGEEYAFSGAYIQCRECYPGEIVVLDTGDD